jgi:O-antigen ligase
LTVALPVLLVLGRGAADTALSLVAVLFLVRSAVMRDWLWLKKPWLRMAAALWAWMLLVSAFAFHPMHSYGAALAWVRFLLFAAAEEYWILDYPWLRRLALATAGTLGFVAVDVIWQFVTGYDVLGHVGQGVRLTGPFLRPEAGVFMVRLLFPALVFLWILVPASCSRRFYARIATVAVGALYFTAIFLTGERAALILSLFGLLIVLVLWQGAAKALIAAIGIVSVAAILVSANPQIVRRQVDSTFQTLRTFPSTPYGELWRSGTRLGLARPVLGVGVQNFRFACSDSRIGLPATVVGRCGLHPHNIYIQWLADTGIVGLLGFVILVGTWLRRFWKVGRRSVCSSWLLGPAIGVFLYLWPLATTGGFFSNWNAVTFWLVLGWALAASRLVEGENTMPFRVGC